MTAFRAHLLRAGLPVGLLLGLWESGFGHSGHWLDFLLTASLSAVALAGLLTAVTEPFVRGVRRSRLRAVGLVCLVFLATVFGGFLILLVAERVPHGTWTRLPDPPEPAQGFAGPTCHVMNGRDDNEVYIYVAGGRYLSYHAATDGPAGWTEEAKLPVGPRGSLSVCPPGAYGSATPFKFGRILARYRIDDDGVDCGGRRHYLIMADRSIWTWSTGECAMAQIAAYGLFLAALVICGLVAGIGRLSSKTSPAWTQQPLDGSRPIRS